DPRVHAHGAETLAKLAAAIRDPNYRLFAERGALHAISAGVHLENTDPFLLWEEMQAHRDKPIDAGHAFYLGYELAKAMIALHLDKDYRQDEALNWGYLTVEEESHRERKKNDA